MAQLGADVDALDQLARKCEEEAQKIEQTVSIISSQLHNTWWQGTDAERFRSDWESTHTSALRQVAEQMKLAGAACTAQANQQRQASSS